MVCTADQTSYINYIKPLILAVELGVPHVLSVIDTKDEWYFVIHPQRMVPALKDRDPVTGQDTVVFESTACLQYLCERFDKEGVWAGRTPAEKGSVLAWTAYQTAALGLAKTFPGSPSSRLRSGRNARTSDRAEPEQTDRKVLALLSARVSQPAEPRATAADHRAVSTPDLEHVARYPRCLARITFSG